jgi:hypothetical protein
MPAQKKSKPPSVAEKKTKPTATSHHTPTSRDIDNTCAATRSIAARHVQTHTPTPHRKKQKS